jgi:hypothetical protein
MLSSTNKQTTASISSASSTPRCIPKPDVAGSKHKRTLGERITQIRKAASKGNLS